MSKASARVVDFAARKQATFCAHLSTVDHRPKRAIPLAQPRFYARFTPCSNGPRFAFMTGSSIDESNPCHENANLGGHKMCQTLVNLSQFVEQAGTANASDVIRVICKSCEKTETCSAVSNDEFDRRAERETSATTTIRHG